MSQLNFEELSESDPYNDVGMIGNCLEDINEVLDRLSPADLEYIISGLENTLDHAYRLQPRQSQAGSRTRRY